ncbi:MULTISPECIES: ATP-binding protein [unclassified Azospirillum]|uniref:ATP-binding protein n=1 Tax=unclassified Azospirillum TaxID=2630922 RepID=UPI000B67C507|nr:MULTISPECIES: ATP-binding protein [unclassified Azospirillum]SNS89017.1 Signal transduction histidine kinase [Azospirillum sp. RU38E]SNT06198.1 Signal transduction histidine kinase [Azospirillum sp. RU37A]
MRALTDRMSYSIFAVLVGGILLSQAIALGLYRSDRAEAVADAEGGQLANCLDGFARAIEEQPTDVRLAVLRGLKERELTVRTSAGHNVMLDVYEKEPKKEGQPEKSPAISIPPFGMPVPPPPEPSVIEVSRQLKDGTWMRFHAPVTATDALREPGFLASLAGSAAVAILLSAWVLGFTTRPLRRFAAAANRLGVDMNAPSLDEAGPREVRLAAAAFNKMQRRLRAFVEDRTRMLAAVSHDLRTPLTRMRLRAEFIDDDSVREKMLDDLAEMEAMIGSTLAFARDEAAQEDIQPLELNAMLERLVEDMRDGGKPASVTPSPFAVPIMGRRMALRRAIANLLENAVKYGQRADIAIAITGENVTITIDDDGPGIPETEFDNVFRPFFRLEGSRSRDTGGTGLGLSVANDIVRAHGGEIGLANRPEGGLRVTVVLPMAGEAVG